MLCASWPAMMLKVLQWNKDHLSNGGIFGKNNSRQGDLTKMAMLDNVAEFRAEKDYQFIPAADSGKNINLYLCGDSYTEDVPGSVFAHVDSFFYGSNLRGLLYHLNRNKKNILLIEVTERFVISMFSTPIILDIIKDRDDPTPPKPVFAGDGKKTYSQIMNQNLEYLLFDYGIINKVRYAKAEATYRMFDRASGNVVISDNGKYLFLRQTAAGYGNYSSYTPVADTTIIRIANTLNEIYDHYRKVGFDEVYFSPIPSPASLLQPGGYNGLIPRLRDNAQRRMPFLDVYGLYKQNPNPESLYRVGDTHWNNSGMQVWLKVVNDELRAKYRGWK